MTKPRIITSFDCTSLWPERDWCAYRDGTEEDETAPRGWGTTDQEAIDDLLAQEEDE